MGRKRPPRRLWNLHPNYPAATFNQPHSPTVTPPLITTTDRENDNHALKRFAIHTRLPVPPMLLAFLIQDFRHPGVASSLPATFMGEEVPAMRGHEEGSDLSGSFTPASLSALVRSPW
jgi:hypothetical protein